MPRVIIDKAGDVRLRPRVFKNFKPSSDALVVSEGEAQAIVASGIGRVVERTDRAIPSPRVQRRRARPAAEPVKTESEGDAG